MSRSRRPPRYTRLWKPSGTPNVKQIESRRVRARERLAVQRGDELPTREAPWTRWDIWSWD